MNLARAEKLHARVRYTCGRRYARGVGVVDVVKSDLAWLVREFEHGTRDHNELRRSSAVVRRLLVDGRLQQARKIAGADGQPKMVIYPLSQMIELSDIAKVELVAAGGCRIEQRLLGPFSVGAQSIPTPRPPVVESLSLPQFMKSVCLVGNGTAFDRTQVVKYVANKLGGVHFDRSRHRKGDESILRLEELDGYMIFRPISVVDVSLLAVIQAMISSVSVMGPFGLQPIELALDVPLEGGESSVVLPSRAWLKMDLMGDDTA